MQQNTQTNKIAFFDWDKTLSADGDTVSPANRAALADFRAKGNRIVLCTGRCLAALPPAALTLSLDGIVAGAGANVLRAVDENGITRRADGTLTAEWVHRAWIPWPLLVEIAETYDTLPQVVCKFEGEERQIYLHQPRENVWKQDLVFDTANDFLAYYHGEHLTKLTLRSSDDTFPPLPQLEEKLFYVRYDTFQEACLPGENKAAGMQKMAAAFGMTPAQTLAFGDSENDREILCAAACGVAMGNAPDAIKAIADRVAPPSAADGVATVLRTFL